MLSQSKLDKLKKQIKDFGITDAELITALNTTKPTLYKVLNGKKYDKDIVAGLIKIRDGKVLEAKSLEAAI